MIGIGKRVYRFLKLQREAVWLVYNASNIDKNSGLLRRAYAKLAARRLALRFGIYVAPSARVGTGLVLPHPTGIVIGEGAVIGSNVTIYQHVTIGRRRSDTPSYPNIGDRVTIYAGAVIVGGIDIGPRSAIGANCVVMNDVADDSVVRPCVVAQVKPCATDSK